MAAAGGGGTPAAAGAGAGGAAAVPAGSGVLATAGGPPGGRGAAGRGATRGAMAGAAVLFFAVAVAGVTWAKWDPYAHKLATLVGSHLWKGSSILTAGGVAATSGPSWHAAWSFTVAYGTDIWVALVAAIGISAAMEALIPPGRVAGLLDRRTTVAGTIVAGLCAVPAMMCTCCSAPLTVTLRRNGAPAASALGWWLANPVLNPAVLAFMAIVAPWQWVLTRIVVGMVVVVAVPLVATRLGGPDGDRSAATSRPLEPATAKVEPFDLGHAPVRFVKAVGRLGITLVPEYFAVVLLIGAFRGWLAPLGADTLHWGFLAVLVAAVAGVLIVIPTAGEIPVLLGLAALGVAPAALGALLITLPAISLPSMAMVGRALGWRTVAVTAASVAVLGLVGGGFLAAIGSPHP